MVSEHEINTIEVKESKETLVVRSVGTSGLVQSLIQHMGKLRPRIESRSARSVHGYRARFCPSGMLETC